jgi:hypothetical protein
MGMGFPVVTTKSPSTSSQKGLTTMHGAGGQLFDRPYRLGVHETAPILIRLAAVPTCAVVKISLTVGEDGVTRDPHVAMERIRYTSRRYQLVPVESAAVPLPTLLIGKVSTLICSFATQQQLGAARYTTTMPS